MRDELSELSMGLGAVVGEECIVVTSNRFDNVFFDTKANHNC